MRIAVYGKKFNDNFIPSVQFMFNKLDVKQVELFVYQQFADFLYPKIHLPAKHTIFKNADDLQKINADLILSVGGDGTILDCITLVKQSGIPILGINTGRLGFLSSISREEIGHAITHILEQNYSLEERSLLQLHSENKLFNGFPYALNEITLNKKDSSSMITVHTYIDDEYLNSYWADGIIVATPTGSTAYSLSCGGPIIVPAAENFIITPISPHNLNVRPIVVCDKSKITLRIEGRDENFLVALDSRSENIGTKETINISKANFNVKLIKLPNENFNQTLRNKLMWGMDRRN